MKNAWLCLFLLTAAVAAGAQTKKSLAPSAGTSPEAKICQEPYQVPEPAAGLAGRARSRALPSRGYSFGAVEVWELL